MTQPAPRRVLVVDDNAEDCAHLRSLLLLGSDQHWRFTDVATGAMALQAIHESGNEPFDCVLLDYHLPDLDAPEVLAQLCEATGLPPCPVVVITGSTAHDGRGLVRAGAQDYIDKAWTTAPSLTRAVDNAIERLAMQREALAGRQALAVERGRLALALTAGQMGVFDLNLSDGSMVWSPEVFALFGVTAGEFAPSRASFRLLVHPEDRCIPWQSLHAAVADCGAPLQADPMPLACEFRIQRPDGQLRWMAQRGQTRRDVISGQVHHHGVVFDITERKRAEAAQALSSQRLRDQQFYTRSLIDANKDGLLVTDPSGTVTDANRQMETLTGRTQSELIGSDFADLFSEPLRAVVSLKRTLICLSLLDHELALLPRDGQQTMVALNSSTFYDRDRSLQGVIFSVRDVTVRHFLNRALQETNASLAGARLTAVQDRRAAIDRLRATNQVMLQQLQSVLNVIARLEAEPPSPDPAHTAKLAQALQHSRVLLESVQSTIAPQAAN